MIEKIEVLNHSCVKFKFEKIIYVDPFKLKAEYKDADIILITHEHFDHYSEEDIEKVKKETTKIVITQDLKQRVKSYGFKEENIIVVKPNETYEVEKIKIETLPAYNVGKKFHPKENGWVGYIIENEGKKYYIAGDTDITEENQKIKCDIALVPVGGTYTMDYKEAATLVNIIKPKIAIPIHYGSIIGTVEDAENFLKLLSDEIKGIRLL